MADESSMGPFRQQAPDRASVGAESLDIRTLLHPTEHSRLLIALSSTAVVFGVAAMVVYAIQGWTVLAEFAGYLTVFAGTIWVSLQVYRSRLLGSAVRVSDSTLPELQSILDEVCSRLKYRRRIDVYIMDKVSGGSVMTTYLGTRLIQIEGGLVADLLSEQHHAELTYLVGRHVGQLKARHQRLQPILLALSLAESLKFLQLFLAPYLRATVKSGDQIGAACCGDIRATAATMNRLLVGKELGPRIAVKGVLDQAATVRRRWLPRLAQLFMSEPHATNRYLNLLAFFASVAPDEIRRWRASLDETTARRITSEIEAAPIMRRPRRSHTWASTLLATCVTGGLLALGGLLIFGSLGSASTTGNIASTGHHSTGVVAVDNRSGRPHSQSSQAEVGVASTLLIYFDAINARNYRVAWSELSAANQAANPYPQFAAGESTTTIADLKFYSISPAASQDAYVAVVTFRSYQAPSEAPNHSDSCDIWTLDYKVIRSSGGWLIDSASPHPGADTYRSC